MEKKKQGFQKGNKLGKKFQRGCIPWSKGKKLKPFSDSHKKNISKAMTGKESRNKGKKLPYITERNLKNNPMNDINCRKKSGLSNKGRSAWNKGMGIPKPLAYQIRQSVKYNEWRSDVYERDNWTCQTCNKRGCILEAHHKKEFAKILKENNIKTFDEAMNCAELWDRKNGVTLCEDCHDLTRRKK